MTNKQVIMPDYTTFCNAAKVLFNGEFKFSIPDFDEEGVEHSREITVPWTTIKEIYQLAVKEYGEPVVEEAKGMT